MPGSLIEFSDSLAALVAAAARGLVSVHPGARAQRSAVLWEPGVLVTSEQGMPDHTDVPVILPGGAAATASLVGRDTGTNVAALRIELPAPPRTAAAVPHVGALALVLGAADGAPTARLAMVHRTGPAWDSMAGGRIDQLIRLDARLDGRDEGGPVLNAAGGLLGMSTLGPRRRVLVIPASTVDRVLPQLLAGGRVAQGWLGLGLQPVSIPAGLQDAAGQDSGLMVVSLAAHGPAEQAGMLPGDILLQVDGAPAPHPRAVARVLRGDRVGAAVPVRLLRAGVPVEVTVTIAERPAA